MGKRTPEEIARQLTKETCFHRRPTEASHSEPVDCACVVCCRHRRVARAIAWRDARIVELERMRSDLSDERDEKIAELTRKGESLCRQNGELLMEVADLKGRLDELEREIRWVNMEYADRHDEVEAEMVALGVKPPDSCYSMAKVKAALQGANLIAKRRRERLDGLKRTFKRLEKLVEGIHALTDPELSWMEVLGRNPGFDEPGFAVEIHTLGLDGSESHKRFEGRDLFECVQKAREALDA